MGQYRSYTFVCPSLMYGLTILKQEGTEKPKSNSTSYWAVVNFEPIFGWD